MRALLALVVTLVLSSSALSQEPDPEELIDFSLEGFDVDRVLKLYADEFGIRILYDEKILKRKVYLLSTEPVKRKDLFGILLSILEMQNFTMVECGPPGTKLWKVVPFTAPIANPSNKGSLPVVSLEQLDLLPESEALATLVVVLKHSDARSAFIAVQGIASDPRMVQTIESTNTVSITDTAQNLRRIGAMIRGMDVPARVEGQPSVVVEACLFEVGATVLEARGIRTSGSREGKPLDQVDVGALWSDLLAASGSGDVRVIHRWTGRILEGAPARSVSRSQSLTVHLSVTAGLPKRPRRTPFVKEAAPAVASPGPVEGEVSLGVTLEVDSTVEGQKLQTEDQTTLAGKEGAWLVCALDLAAQGKTVRLFFARASR